ncbi:MAG: lipopolysaccharide transport periplasmic protein LptA [Desulfobacterales bacterium]
MKIFHCKKLRLWLVTFLLFVAVFGMIIAVPTVEVTGQQNPSNAADEKKIQITADVLIADNESGFAEFIGNVRATQGTTVITSDRLKVFYKDDAAGVEKMTGSAGAMEKIVATGNVNINMDDRKAVSNQAEYSMEKRILVLSGPDSKVTTANESIAGSVITFYRDDGRIKVEGAKDKQVEAVFFDTEQIGSD